MPWSVASANAFTSKASSTSMAATNIVANPGDLIVVTFVFDNLSFNTPTVTSLTKRADETASWVIMESTASASASAGGIKSMIAYIVPTVTWPGDTVTATLSAAVVAKAFSYSVFRHSQGAVSGVVMPSPSAATILGYPWGTGYTAGRSILNAGGASASGDANPIQDILKAGSLVVFSLGGETSTVIATPTDAIGGGTWAVAASAATSGGSAVTNQMLKVAWKETTTDFSGGVYRISPNAGSDTHSGLLVFSPAIVPAPPPPPAAVSSTPGWGIAI